MVRTESSCGKLLMWRTRDPALLLQEPHLHIREARHKALPLHQSLEPESHLRFRVTLALVQNVKAKHPHDPHEGRQGGRRFREGCKDLDGGLFRFGHPESIRSTGMCQPARQSIRAEALTYAALVRRAEHLRYDPCEGGDGEGLLEKRPAGLLDPGHLIARHEQDLHLWLKFPRPYSEFATTHDRHHDIDEQEIRNARPVVQHSNGFQRIGGAEYGIAVRSEDILGERTNLWLVIHDQDRALCRLFGSCVGRSGCLFVRACYPPVNLPASHGQRGPFDPEDQRRPFERDPSAANSPSMCAARANRRRHDASGSPLRVARHSGKRSVPPTRSGWPVRRTTLVNHTHNKLEK